MKNISANCCLLLLCLVLLQGLISADTVTLRSGATLEGTYLGGTEDSVKFQSEFGVTYIPKTEIVSMQMGSSTPPAAAQTTPATSPATASPAAPATPAPQAGPVVVPAGTILLIRMQNTVSSNSKTGTRFSALLQSDLKAGNVVAAKAGTQVYGQVTKAVKPGRIAGRPVLELALTELSINGDLVPIVTTSYSESGDSSFRKTARGAAAGAIIGEVSNDDAGGGAAIGATVGALKKPDSITVPTNTVLEFRLSQPLHK